MEKFEESLNSDLKINSLFFISRVIFAYLALFSLDVILLQYFSTFISREQLSLILTTVNILWVVLNSTLINLFLSNIIFVSLELRKGKAIPNLIKSLAYTFIYLIAFVVIYKYILLLDLTSLLASMGVMAMVIGFAIQSNISNIFSGIALNLERTIEIDDWIEFAEYEEGKVVDINWRTTTLACRDGRIIHIPNSVAADHPLTNFSKSKQLMQVLVVDVNLKYNPSVVTKLLLDSMQNITHVVDIPIPEAGIKEIEEWSVKYKMIYYIDTYSKRFKISQDIWTNVWTNLTKEGIEPSISKEEVTFQIKDKQSNNKEIEK